MRIVIYEEVYLRDHYEGWKFFPHQRLWYGSSKREIHLTNSNGATYDFHISGSQATLAQTYAVSNLGDHEIPCGRFDPRNTKITFENTICRVFSPDGSNREYHREGNMFLLAKETLPNGKVLKYHYDQGNLSLIESLDPKERYVYASLQVQGAPIGGWMQFTSSTGQVSSYIFESRGYKGRFKEGKQKKNLRKCNTSIIDQSKFSAISKRICVAL